MRPADKHLTPQELDLLLLNPADSRDSNASGALPPEAQQHLNGCEYCQSVAEKCRNAEEALRNLRTWGRTSGGGKALAPGSECPREDTWSTLAAGLMNDEEAGPFITHAATCGWCGPRLKEAMHDLAQDITAEEQEALAKLPSSSPGWQRARAQELAAASRNVDVPLVEVETPAKNKEPKSKEKAGFGWWPKLAWGTALPAVAIIAIAVGWLVWLKTREPDVNALLAQAYTDKHQRAIELRMTGVSYGPPPSRERGIGKRDLPAEFYTAKGIIKGEVAKHPKDPAWLQAQARANLLEWDYSKAIEELDDALMLKPGDPALLLDKATALFERAESNMKQGALDYGEAAEDLALVLDKNPDNAVALFNRSILYERLELPRKAIEDLNHYIQVDPTGSWATEAKERLERLKKQVKNQEINTSQALLSPEEFNRHITADSAPWDEIDLKIEKYFTTAISEWLPSAAAKSSLFEASQARMALMTLAEIAKERHEDLWFAELIAQQDESHFAPAITALAISVRANSSGRFLLAREEAARAQRLFQESSNRAGEARGALEEIYALQLSDEADQCLTKAAATTTAVAPYRWLSIHLKLEQAACLTMKGEIGRAEKMSIQAWQAAGAAHYPGLSLRALGFIAGIYWEEGRLREAWNTCLEGLEIYWSGSPYTMSGYNFYSFMDLMAEQGRQFRLNVAIDEQALALLASSSDLLLRAEEHRRLSQAAMAAGLFQTAEANLLLSQKFLASAPQDEITENYRTQAEVEQARLDGKQNKTGEALARLQLVYPRISQISNQSITSEYYQVLGELRSATGNLVEAESAFLSAIEMAERELNSLNSEAERLSWARQSALPYYSMVELKLAQGDAAAALRALERYRGAGIRRHPGESIARSMTSTDLISEKASLSPDSTLLVYALLPRGPTVWISDNHGLEARRLSVNISSLTEAARAFLESCEARSSRLAKTQDLARTLYSMLIAPVADRLHPSRTLMIETDPDLKIPFQALIDDQGRYLIQTTPVVYIPGLYYLFGLNDNAEQIARQKSLVVASNLALEQYGLGNLPDVEAEAREVAERLPGSDLLLTKEATLNAVRNKLGLAAYFHFGGHAARINGTLGLLLAGQNSDTVDILDSEKVSRIRLTKLQVATLAACSTENGTDGWSGDAESLARAFLRGGAPHVVASRWNVESAASRELMRLFYDQLKSGISPARALAVAELGLSRIPGKELPYYWAGFDAFGYE